MAKNTESFKNYYKCDVLITGAGPAGASLAVFLSGTGLDIILIDKKRHIEEPLRCAEYVPAAFTGLFGFKLKGIDNRIEKLQTFINIKPSRANIKELNLARGINCLKSDLSDICPDAELSSCRNETGRLLNPLPGNLVPASEIRAPGYIMDRKTLIKDWIARFVNSGGRYLPSTKAFKISGSQITALKDGEKIIIKAQIIAGADGPVSLAAGHAGCACRHFLAGINLKYKNPDAGPACRSTKVFFLPEIKGGYAWIFPGQKFTNYGLGADLGLFCRHEKKPGVQKKLFEKIFGNVLKNAEDNNLWKNNLNSLCGRAKLSSGLIPVSGIAANPVYKNIILLGDAAGLCNPVTGAGIYNAVYSAKIAAKYILEAAAGKGMPALQQIRKEYNDYFKGSIDRALAKRKEISSGWQSQKTPEQFERFVKTTWVAFRQYWQI
jgi:digeranylgeranylglycerophospholipid reductase